MSYHVLIFGSRDWDDEYAINAVLNGYQSDEIGVVILQGGARGADRIAKRWAKLNAQPCVTYRADWEQYGRAAGPRRNESMLADGKPEVAWGFITKPLVESRGNADMVRRLKAAGVPCYIVTREEVSGASERRHAG